MISWTEFFFLFMIGAALLLSLLGLWFTVIVPIVDRWSKRFFRHYFIILMLCCLFSIVDYILMHVYSAPKMAVYIVWSLISLFLALPLPMLTRYLLHCCGESIRKSKLFRSVLVLWVIYLIMLMISPFTNRFAYITSNGVYSRGPWYPLLMVPLVLILLLDLAGTIQRGMKLSHRIFLSFVVALLPMTIAMTLQVFIDVFPLIDISIVLSTLSMYSLIASDQIEQDRSHQQEIARQQVEIANQRASIMVLQMRPHFIYNTMMIIYCLCNQDPQRARQVVLDFTTYLRKNFTAIASDTLILFTSELEHTRAYLAVEQALHEDSLIVDYDTPHTWFRVPPLTLQPIVENAIRHGRDPYIGPLHISIRTQKTNSGSVIVISDDGCGFHPTDDDKPHIGLSNIRQRLEMMCGGSLMITTRDGGGTVVTMTIPDSNEKDNV